MHPLMQEEDEAFVTDECTPLIIAASDSPVLLTELLEFHRLRNFDSQGPQVVTFERSHARFL